MRITHDKILTISDVCQLLSTIDARIGAATADEMYMAELDRLVVVALLSSGMRNSEMCGLRVRDTIVGSGVSAFAAGRNRSRGRLIYVPQHVSATVVGYVRDCRPRFLPPGVAPDDLDQPLLMSEHRRAFDRTSLYRRVVKILTEAGLGERANVQLLRHTYGYLAYLRTGGNLLFVQRQLGHAHPTTTMAYAELVEESYADLAERVLPAEAPGPARTVVAGERRTPRFDCAVD
jgi:site-specific recombinase XerD